MVMYFQTNYLLLINEFILDESSVKDSSTQYDQEMQIICKELMENQVND